MNVFARWEILLRFHCRLYLITSFWRSELVGNGDTWEIEKYASSRSTSRLLMGQIARVCKLCSETGSASINQSPIVVILNMIWSCVKFVCSVVSIANWTRPRLPLSHCSQDKKSAISQTALSNAFSWMKLKISIKISLNSIYKGPINNIPPLVHIMAWHQPRLITDAYMHHARQWVYHSLHKLSGR